MRLFELNYKDTFFFITKVLFLKNYTIFLTRLILIFMQF